MLLPLWRLVRRRWLTALAGVLLAAAICLWVNAHVQPEYRATGQTMFLLPPEQPDPEDPPVNPYLNLPEGMSTTANLIAGMVTTDDVSRSLADRGLVAEYTVSLVPGSGPVLVFDVTAADPETALETRDALMAMVDQDLATLQEQAKTPANQVMTATRPTVSHTAETLHAPVYKALAGAGGAGIAMALLLCLLVDRLTRVVSGRASRARSDALAEVVAAARERSRLRRMARDHALTRSSEPDPVGLATLTDGDETDGAEREHPADDGVPDVRGHEGEDEAGDPARAPRKSEPVTTPSSRRSRDRTARRGETERLDRAGQLARDDEDAPRKLAG